MKAALIQQSFTANKRENMAQSAARIREAAKNGARLIVLSELHNGLYFCQSENPDFFDLAETIPGESTDYFGAIAKELKVALVLSLFEKRAKGLYHNTALVIETNGTIAGKYRKMHVPDDPAFYEKFYFTQGDLGFKPIETSAGKLGVLVCWDQWFPEAARLMALNGADILIYPTAIGWDLNDSDDEKARQLEAWKTIQRSHAIANALPVISANRVGFEKERRDEGAGIDFWGHSFICGAQGEVIASADQSATILYADLDFNRSEKVRRIWPFLRDRRVDSYADLTKRFVD
ncbi:MAG: carbon-nitrogen hydrolase [Helicobacteraceae bacterium]|jgi:N-carbamoylputrescine amidase|nr:carbon-nitrogen hydrolase [Helicobacteraceae bacterium]